MKKHWTKLLAMLIVVLVVMALVPMQKAEAMSLPWEGGDSSHSHNVSSTAYVPINGTTHDVKLFCSCGAVAHLTEKHSVSSGTCPDCGGTVDGSSGSSSEGDKSSSEPQSHKVTVYYRAADPADRAQMPRTYGWYYLEGEEFNIPSPAVPGFKASRDVSGKMGTADITVDVYYTRVEEPAPVEENPAPVESPAQSEPPQQEPTPSAPPQQEAAVEATSAPEATPGVEIEIQNRDGKAIGVIREALEGESGSSCC